MDANGCPVWEMNIKDRFSEARFKWAERPSHQFYYGVQQGYTVLWGPTSYFWVSIQIKGEIQYKWTVTPVGFRSTKNDIASL